MGTGNRDGTGGQHRGLMVLVGLSAVTITVAGLKASSGILAPLLLALMLVITVYPVRHWLDRKGLPAWLGSLTVVAGVYVILVLLMLALAMSIEQVVELIPQYAQELNDLVANLRGWLQAHGVQAGSVRSVFESLDPGKLVSFATGVLSQTFDLLSKLLLVAVLVLFFGFDAGTFVWNLGSERWQRPQLVQALTTFARETREYFAVTAGFGFVVAVIDAAALALMGLPGVFAWGVLAFVTNFIPNVGFVIGLIPPAIIGLLEGGIDTMVIVIVVYAVTNLVIQVIIQPRLVGYALGLSATLTFVSLLFWGWVLGALGAVLAIPLTLLAKALLMDVEPRTRWLLPFVSGRPPDRQSSTPTDNTD